MKNIIPALADLTQDIAGPIPLDLIKAWVNSEGADSDHNRILDPHKRFGTMVSSDSAGLSKLSAGRPLIEVMKLVSEPKEIIHSHGVAIGGRAVGIWSADNTQMFYEGSIDVNDIVLQMVAAQRKIDNVTVSVGIGLHKGTSYEIGGGLYGLEADEIEEFTEERSEAGEIIVSSAIKNELREEFLQGSERGGMFIIDHAGLEVSGRTSEDVYYPAPFDRAFHDALLQLQSDAQMEKLHNERVKESTIVLFRVFHPHTPRLLDQFTLQAATNTIIHNVCRNYQAKIVKSNGSLAIISCKKEGEGVDLAIALMQAAKENDLQANVGLSRGEVLIFDLGEKGSDLAGGPVNIASKLAEDTDERGKLFFEGVEAEHAKRHGFDSLFGIEKSGVTIQGVSGSI